LAHPVYCDTERCICRQASSRQALQTFGNRSNEQKDVQFLF